MTLDEALARFHAALEARHYAPTTRAIYRTETARFIAASAAASAASAPASAAGAREITSVTRAEIERYQLTLARSSLAPETQAMRMRAVKRFFEWLVERGDLFETPTTGIAELPPGSRGVARRLPEVLTVEEVRRLLAQPNTGTPTGVRARAVLELLYATGMRRAELVALDVADVDLALGMVRIRVGKGRKGRVVPFGREAKRWLGEYVRTVRPRWQRSGDGRGDRRGDRERAFFLDRSGRRLSGQVVYQTVKAAARTAGLTKRCNVHSLRHACATHMIAAGADIVTVQRQLGHADPGITSAVYTRVYPADLKAEHRRTHPRERGRGKAKERTR